MHTELNESDKHNWLYLEVAASLGEATSTLSKLSQVKHMMTIRKEGQVRLMMTMNYIFRLSIVHITEHAAALISRACIRGYRYSTLEG